MESNAIKAERIRTRSGWEHSFVLWRYESRASGAQEREQPGVETREKFEDIRLDRKIIPEMKEIDMGRTTKREMGG